MHAQSDAIPRYKGAITLITNEAIKFDNELLLVYHTDPKLLPILELGLVYPDLLRATAAVVDPKAEIVHKITITEFKILSSASPKIKEFQFVALYNDGSKPKLFHLELTNETGHWKMDILTFIQGSRVLTLRKI